MSGPEPPALAIWLMSRLVIGEKRESMIGDLVEQHRQRRSSIWFWRQAMSAIVIGMAAEIGAHPFLAVFVMALSTFLSDVYVLVGLPVWASKLDRLWYPHAADSSWGWLVIDPWAYRLQPYLVTTRAVWCALLAAVSWILSRSCPRQRALAVTFLLLPQVLLGLPYLSVALTDWLRDPGNPLWFFRVLWFALFAFVAIPASILWGGLGFQERGARKTV